MLGLEEDGEEMASRGEKRSGVKSMDRVKVR